MRKNNIILLFVLLFAITASTCKKRYPKDIPRWLKEKIEALEKASKGKGCRIPGFCNTIEEYSDGSSTYYWITKSYSPTTYDIYNYNGQIVCAETYGYGSGGCYTEGYNKNFIRLIWQEN